MSTKPNAMTRPKLASRARIRRDRVVPRGEAFQTALSEACTSPKTPLIASRIAPSPMSVASVPERRSLALRIIAWMADAVSRPINPLN